MSALRAGGLDDPLKSQREAGLTRALQVGIPPGYWQVTGTCRGLASQNMPPSHTTGPWKSLMVMLDFKAQPPEMHHLAGSLDRLGNLPSALGLRH